MLIDLKVNIKGLREVKSMFDGLEKKLPEIEHFAMINAGEKARDAVAGQMFGVFDKPTPFIIKSLRLTDVDGGRVGKRSVGKSIKVGFKDVFASLRYDPVFDTLNPHIEGGPRVAKPSELRLRRAGILRAGEFIIPSRTAPLNKYGNIRGGEMTRILSDLKAFNEAGYNANRTKGRAVKGRGIYFIASPGGTRGIYQMTGGQYGKGINLVFIIVKKAPTYRKRLDFYGTAQREFDRVIEKEFDKVYARYLRKLK